jgi:3-hydroxyacyl-CoA dehydrogenase
MPVHKTIEDGIAVITLESPPVNGFGFAVRSGLAAAIHSSIADASVNAIIVTGSGRVFSGGADLTEFNTPRAEQSPNLRDVIAAIEASSKPIIMAINGAALGGGLEVAMAGHYRIAAKSALLGLPEVKIGILPGAGGTQRLPRAVGLETAVNMIVSGEPVPATRFAGTSLLDEVVESDVVAAAVAFAKRVANKGELPLIRNLEVKHKNAEGFLDFARNSVAAVAGPYPAPMKCLDAIEASFQKSFDEGMAAERAGFTGLIASTESKALRHGFLGERAASKIADVGKDVQARAVKTVGIIGAGTMGGGIAMNFLNAGIPVTIVETKQDVLDRGIATIRGNYDRTAKKGKLTTEQVEQRMALLTPTLSFDDLKNVDLIIEAVFEDLGVKESVFRQMDAIAKPGAILASNTSTLDLDKIAAFTRRPQDVVGMHFFSPANVMKLLEVVRGEKSAKDVLATVMAVAKVISKTPVVSGVCDGFIGNRMLDQYTRQAGFLLDEGATPQQVDKAMEKFGFAMGPFRMGDLAGNDIGWAIRKRRYVEKPDVVYSKAADLICEAGRFGQKAGKGWYDYKPADRTAYPSDEVAAILEKNRRDLGLANRKISDEEIVQRLIFALANAGARILEEGIAAKASDIDIVYLTGYGFPAWRGGPMFYADTVGLYNVLAAMRGFGRGYQGTSWEPAPLLVELAEAGKWFTR